MAFPARFLEELEARSDLSELASRYTALTQRGGRMVGLCPFHNEKTPSFSVSPGEKLFYCFGCQAGGGVFQFVMRAENLEFREAVHFLAQRAGLEVPSDGEDQGLQSARARIAALNKDAARFFHETLLSPEGEAARAYLRGRALSKGTLTRFGLGAAPDRWDALLTAMQDKGYSKAALLEAGLAVQNKSGGLYDRFRNRVMFPILDLRKQIVGFGGRVLDDSMPKYLNSSDSPLFSKSRNLFALNFAKNTKMGKLLLVEGYMDVLALHQAGIDCAVASLGTALTEAQAGLLSRYTKEAVLAYDTDTAGKAAAERAIPILRKAGLNVRVLRLTGAKDPDEYIRQNGSAAFAGLLHQAENHLAYRLDSLVAQYELSREEDRVAFAKAAVSLLSGVPDAVEREVFARRAASMAGISEEVIFREVLHERKRRQKKAEQNKQYQNRQSLVRADDQEKALRKKEAAEEEVIFTLLHQPERVLDTSVAEKDFDSAFLGAVFGRIRRRVESGLEASFQALTQDFPPEGDEAARLAAIAMRPLRPNAVAFEDSLRYMLRAKQLRDAESGEDPLLVLAKEKRASGG